MNKTNQQDLQFAMIRSWQESGLNQKQYCAAQSISYPLFHYWYKRYRVALGIHSKKESPFVSIPGPLISGSAQTELVLPDGRRLVFHQPVSADFLKSLIG
jgi:hypothetical protein